MSDPRGRGAMERLIRGIWRLYPRRMRERFGAELERDLAERRATGRPVGLRELADATLTLGRAWGAVVRDRSFLGGVQADVGLALRTARRSPGYALVVVAILALALGGNTAVFSVTHAVLLDALPYGEPERVFELQPAPAAYADNSWVVDPDFEALPQVEAAALYIDGGGANLTIGDVTTRVTVAQVTPDFFRVLGVEPLLGAGLAATSDDPAVVVLSHAFWVRAFSADDAVVGRTLELNGRAYRVTGVVPEDVAFPSPVDLWVPFPVTFDFFAGAFGPSAIGRLSGAGAAPTVQSVLDERQRARYAEVLAEQTPPPGLTLPPVRVTPLREQLTGSIRAPLLVLLTIAGLVVLLGCLNLAGVVLSRTAARADELAVRRALGAGRWRLFTQLLTEVVVLAVLAGGAGLGTATLTMRILEAMLPADTPGLDNAGLGAPVLAFTAGVTVLAGLVVGVLPALKGSLESGSVRAARTATQDHASRRAQGGLVVAQVALAFVLAAGSGLLGRSLANLESAPVGYDLEHVLTFWVRLPEATYPDSVARGAYTRELQARLRGVASVSAVGAATYLPRKAMMFSGLRLKPAGAPDEDGIVVTYIAADSAYFRAMGIPVLLGTPFEGPRPARSVEEAVLNQSLAERLFPDGVKVGGELDASGSGGWVTARLGAVVGDVYMGARDRRPDEIVYTRLDVGRMPFLAFAVRSDGDPTRVVERVREVVASVDPSVPPYMMETTGQTAAATIRTEAATARLSWVFSGSALLLSALGLYGLVSQAVARRRRELGIRLALGARPERLVRGALAGPLVLTAFGLTLGVGAALAAGGLLEPLLYEVAPRDPTVLITVVAVVLAVAAGAAYLPARRTLALDPAESLRPE